MNKELIKDRKQLAHPKLKFIFDVLFLIGVVLLIIKLGTVIVNKVTDSDFTLYGGSFFWNFGSLSLMIGAGIGSSVVKERHKKV